MKLIQLKQLLKIHGKLAGTARKGSVLDAMSEIKNLYEELENPNKGASDKSIDD